MQTFVVIGAFQFIGFHLAKHLLDQGEEVVGIDWEDELSEAIMEKEMEIGRNSNFLYIPLHRLHQLSLLQPKQIYISCYDVSISTRQDKPKIIQQILAFLKRHDASQVIYLLKNEADLSLFDSLLQQAEEKNTAKIVYAPTIYGPWQPETMSFEAAIREKEKEEIEKAIETEDSTDALFIADIMEALIEIPSHHKKSIVLQSKAANQWNQCAALLWKDEFARTSSTTTHSSPIKGHIYKVENKTSPAEGISLQKKHRQLLEMWREKD